MYNRIQDEKEKWMQPLLSLNLQPQSSPNHLFTPHEEAKPNRYIKCKEKNYILTSINMNVLK